MKLTPRREREERWKRARLALLLAAACGLTIAGCGTASDVGTADRKIPSIGIEEDLRIDGYAEDLVPIQWLGVASTGRIALLQWQDYTVRFYDSSGAFLKSVGREGEGPGEFRRLVRAGWIGDTLWVSDTQLRRATLISPELEVVRTVRNHDVARPMPADSTRFSSYSRPSPYAIYDDGSTLVWAISPVDPDASPDDGDGSPIFRLSPDGYIRNLVARSPGYEGLSVEVRLAGGGVAFGQIPFVPRPAWVVSPRGSRLATLTTDMAAAQPYFRAFVADAAGEVVFDRSFPFEPEPIPAAVMDSAITARVARRDSSIRYEIERKLRDAAPARYAEAERLVIGSEDRVWIGMRPRAEGTRWLVLSPTGDPIGEIALPPRVSLSAAGPTHVWCIERDDFDVESVVRYRLIGTASGLEL